MAFDPKPAGTSTDRPVLHGSFTLTRHLEAPPSRVFAAFSEPLLRKRWFRIPSRPDASYHELDFRVGGGEIARGTFAAAGVPELIEYRSQFLDVVTNERIVLVNELLLDGLRRSASLVTVELAGDAGGTLLTYTEQYVFLDFTGDGQSDIGEREGGTRLQLNGLRAVVESPGDETS